MKAIDVIFENKANIDSARIVDYLFVFLQKLQIDFVVDGFNGNVVHVDDLIHYIASSNRSDFLICGEEKEICFVTYQEFDFSRLFIKGFFQDWLDSNVLISQFVKLNGFIQARVFDYSYDLWQNMDDIQYYDSKQRDHSVLPKKSNGLPFPLQRDAIDISKNPGRWAFKNGYFEAIGSIMWLGEYFWNYVGQDKKQRLLAESWVRTEVLENGVVKLVAADECFMDESTADKQNHLREILYGSGQ